MYMLWLMMKQYGFIITVCMIGALREARSSAEANSNAKPVRFNACKTTWLRLQEWMCQWIDLKGPYKTRWDKDIEIVWYKSSIWSAGMCRMGFGEFCHVNIIQPLGLDEVLLTSTEGQKHQLRSAQGRSPEGWRMKDYTRRDHIIQKSFATINNNNPTI